MLKGIIVADKHNWAKTKKSFDFAMLYNGNADALNYNIEECEKLNIPYAIYFHSQAYTENMLQEELSKICAQIETHKPFAIFGAFATTWHRSMGAIALTRFIQEYINILKDANQRAGIFTNEYHLTHHIIPDRLNRKEYIIWQDDIAENITTDYDICQEDNRTLVMSEDILKTQDAES